MTVIAVLAEPPRPGLVLSDLAETSPLSEDEAAALYAAMLKDICTAVERSGGDLLVNYRPDDQLPEEFVAEHSAEAEIRSVVADALGGTGDVRFEPQVGSTFAARAGNTVSHLLNEEEVHSVAVARPVVPLLGRTHIDSAAMKLRSTPVVLGPSTEGRVYFSGFREPIDFTDAYETPEIETLAECADDADRNLDYIPMLPVLETGADLATVVPMLRSRVEAERVVPEHTTTFVFDHGLRVEETDGVLELVRG
ncbi:DUF2064 domain-containing protein [Haloferax mediterranei ATCC 33500]|uniref:DUF2064 domain-containing protein n=1 Tax=Haloferax mediterranei (strain ATCC 33500 / DSM 1411 / JCM 8866 / NBRC 14739 / NCIMB 2177 / R-4) TaxID=523841 RepID=I3R8B9_HALMT|nr:DUF2064 domain-containing protein [Haloferax mediterranei]AFK20479.1 hypothetical protein HFX_2805 [Haloferax mediterranei ATCC 33500]AHZ23840.1 hypothetical protein BM92_14830 [Haloferax mediterranei ATCC 33500]ELZ98264.1 hypothetical protein C439_15805 [Haloferax mediterranei ATCC 33500]MDX5986764.1 DUF2064 domain-containing protein [Haloferax mediterranei ATCC 33500]QCQ76089.1 DUF2064 domain-containing protein [Haloferax mediterranei ATCC 33500]